ncbi:hypothetical protein LTR66_015016, partial [Elasticomyces elasticus]
MAEPAGARTPTAQAVKAAQGSISALLEEIKATEQTNHALGGLSRRLSSAENTLGTFASAINQADFCKLSLEIQHHIRMAIWGSQDACARFQIGFQEWNLPNYFLHETDGDELGIFESLELRLLSERLQLLEKAIGMALEVSTLVIDFSTPRDISDEECTSVL